MIEEKRINKPSTRFGLEKFFNELQDLFDEGYRVPKNFGKASCYWGARHAITLVKETPEEPIVENPLDKLSNPKLKKDEVINIAKEDFGLEVPEDLKSPNAIKKFIRDSVESNTEQSSEE